jgi:hypothetical protein
VPGETPATDAGRASSLDASPSDRSEQGDVALDGGPGVASVPDSRLAGSPVDGTIDGGGVDRPVLRPDRIFACDELLSATGNLMWLLRDPFTGLPYDNVPCGPPSADGALTLAPAWGVVPQLASGGQTPFCEDAGRVQTTVVWSFEDRDPDEAIPSLLFALRIALHLDDGVDGGVGNRFGGLTWGANADVSRYDRIRIRYRTRGDSAWQLKLNSGTDHAVEPAHVLPASSTWTDLELAIADAFPGTDAKHLNYLTFAADLDAGNANPELWIDQVSFLADPAHVADCDPGCPDPLPAYPDLACYEPQTGAVNIANALSYLVVAPAMKLLDADLAKAGAEQIVASLETFPTAEPGGGVDAGSGAGTWFQDWHSPTSRMPSPRNHMASITDQPQLYAALMLVETMWPELAARASAVLAKLDFARLYDGSGGCPGVLHGGIDRCAGLSPSWTVDYFGNDSLLGSFLAVATGAAPACFWTQGLAAKGCGLDGTSGAPWYGTGRSCMNADIPASDSGGPFVQLAGLLYLSSDLIPMGTLSLRDSARNMLRAQYDFATSHGAPLAGWASASDPNACAYMTCADFTADKVVPYVSAMAAADDLPQTYRMLRDFHLFGVDAQLVTGSHAISLGMRDAWNQGDDSTGDRFLYLDAGWSFLGLVNGCDGDLLRHRFATHPIAQAGYAKLASVPPPCP